MLAGNFGTGLGAGHAGAGPGFGRGYGLGNGLGAALSYQGGRGEYFHSANTFFLLKKVFNLCFVFSGYTGNGYGAPLGECMCHNKQCNVNMSVSIDITTHSSVIPPLSFNLKVVYQIEFDLTNQNLTLCYD